MDNFFHIHFYSSSSFTKIYCRFVHFVYLSNLRYHFKLQEKLIRIHFINYSEKLPPLRRDSGLQHSPPCISFPHFLYKHKKCVLSIKKRRRRKVLLQSAADARKIAMQYRRPYIDKICREQQKTEFKIRLLA